MMTNCKTKKAGGNRRIALWPENLGKMQNIFFFSFVLLKWEQFTVVNYILYNFKS